MLGKSLRARVNLRRTTTQRWSEMKPGFHQIGTTRAHVDPRHGVVDSDCRVHGIANLFVAGSSVFPTAGRVNPTLTLVALAIRLSEKIQRSLIRGGGG
jgi:choline dehydrogenase-like flavoprotein